MADNVALREQLKDYMAQLPVIDMHEHFVTEEEHLQTRFTFFHLFIPYVQYDF